MLFAWGWFVWPLERLFLVCLQDVHHGNGAIGRAFIMSLRICKSECIQQPVPATLPPLCFLNISLSQGPCTFLRAGTEHILQSDDRCISHCCDHMVYCHEL